MISEGEEGDKLFEGRIFEPKIEREWSEQLMKYLPIALVLLLTLGNYLQSRDIEHLAGALRTHMEVDPASYREEVKKTIKGFELRLRVIEK